MYSESRPYRDLGGVCWWNSPDENEDVGSGFIVS